MPRLFRILLLFIFAVFLTGSFSFVAAQDYKTDYTVEYAPNRSSQGLTTRVNFTVKTTNLKSDVFVKKFSLSFPKHFRISNVNAQDDAGAIKPSVSENSELTTVSLDLNNPKLGKDLENTVKLVFDQNNLFQINGNIWEVIIPTIENRGEGSYNVVVSLPDADKKIAISKPKPTKIEGSKIFWDNPPGKIIYGVFGSTQAFNLNLTYNLKNDRLTPVFSEVAFIPDTAHQKVFVNTINPTPNSVYTDEDGNVIGKYYLKPKESKTVQYSGAVQLLINSRDEVRILSRSKIKDQERYLLNESNYWKLTDPGKFKQLKTARDIYNFLVQNFKYNYKRVSQNKSFGRLGADIALQKPDQAICVEFTDSFIALAREQGIKSRELQGYAVTQDQTLRPLSLVKDVLHSWIEYYDDALQDWIQVDPTWENTSGIDYFTSFDLNHIAFAIHGKSPTSPAPAGAYKVSDTKDIIVQTALNLPQENKKISISKVELPKTVNDAVTTKGVAYLKNEGNTFLYDLEISFSGENLDVSPAQGKIDQIAPYEEKKIEFFVKPSTRNKFKKGKVMIQAENYDSEERTITISPSSYSIGLWVGILVAAISGLLLFSFRIGMRKRRS